MVTCWTWLQKEKHHVKYTFIFICRVEVYTKVHETVNKTNCFIVRSMEVTVSDLLCSFYSCLCWFSLRGKERKTKDSKKMSIGVTLLLSGAAHFHTDFTWAQWSYSTRAGQHPSAGGSTLPHPQEWVHHKLKYKRRLYCVAQPSNWTYLRRLKLSYDSEVVSGLTREEK